MAQFRDFQFALHNLDYETNVTVFVSARNAGNERSSNNLSLSFTTPPCLQMHDDANLTICGKPIVLLIFQSSVSCSR